jgi:putative heme-binding domain-containing protein
MILGNEGQLAVESLWAIYVSGGFDEPLAERLLEHANEDVRAWTIRLLGDSRRIAPPLLRRLVERARMEPSPAVRNQLACTCKRLPGADALPVVAQLLRRDEDVDDPQIPLLLWWAVEDKAITDREQVVGLLADREAWQVPLLRKHLLARIARRYAAEGTEAGLAACARLLALAPGDPERQLLLGGIEQEFAGRPLRQTPPALQSYLVGLGIQDSRNPVRVRLALRLGSPEAHARALQMVADSGVSEADRLMLLETLSQLGRPESLPIFLDLFRNPGTVRIQSAILAALQRFPDEKIGHTVLAAYAKLSPDLQSRARDLLGSRKPWTLDLLQTIDRGQIPAQVMPTEQVQRLLLHNDPVINQLVEKHWGKVRAATPGELQARMNDLAGTLGRGKGDPVKGHALFKQHCATCHQLFGEGSPVGPDLTGADRRNRDFLLTSIVDPSAVIRSEYVAYVAETTDGRVLTGLLVESTPKTVTLLDAKNQRTVMPREQIADLKASPLSLMPEKILDPLQPQEVRDLFRYLQLADKP